MSLTWWYDWCAQFIASRIIQNYEWNDKLASFIKKFFNKVSRSQQVSNLKISKGGLKTSLYNLDLFRNWGHLHMRWNNRGVWFCPKNVSMSIFFTCPKSYVNTSSDSGIIRKFSLCSEEQTLAPSPYTPAGLKNMCSHGI